MQPTPDFLALPAERAYTRRVGRALLGGVTAGLAFYVTIFFIF